MEKKKQINKFKTIVSIILAVFFVLIISYILLELDKGEYYNNSVLGKYKDGDIVPKNDFVKVYHNNQDKKQQSIIVVDDKKIFNK